MRDPSIHIPLSILKGIIRQAGSLSGDDLAEYILSAGKKYTLDHRKKLDTYDTKTKKTITKLGTSSTDDARLFAGLLTTIRQGELKHRGVTTIREGTQDWATIKEVTSKARAFSEANDLGLRHGFIVYIKLFFALSGKGRANIKQMAGKYDFISATYEAQQEIANDPTPETTQKCFIEYAAEVGKRTGIRVEYRDQPTKYIYFLYAKELAKKFGITPGQYIRASFETLDWTNGIPQPSQLVSKNNEDRIIKWMAENNVAKMHITKPKESSKTFWANIKSYDDRTQQQ